MAPWLAAAGAFVVSLDSMMNIAFPAMAAGFGVPPESIRWVIICYTGVYAITAFAGGAVADLVGHLRVFKVGVALTAVALAGGGMATSFDGLLAARVLQGVAGGLIYGTAPGMVTLAVAPEARGRALGSLNAAIALGLAIGPPAAGVLVDVFGWRAVFATRVPCAIVVLVAAFALQVASRPIGTSRLVALADIRRPPVPVVCMLAFLSWAGIFSIWLLAPFYLVDHRGLGAAAGGVIFMLAALGTTIAAPLAGRAADRIGPALPLIGGLALEAVGLAALALADARTPTAVVAVALFAAGLGLGVFQVPMMALVMGAFSPELQGAAGGLTFLARTHGLLRLSVRVAARGRRRRRRVRGRVPRGRGRGGAGRRPRARARAAPDAAGPVAPAVTGASSLRYRWVVLGVTVVAFMRPSPPDAAGAMLCAPAKGVTNRRRLIAAMPPKVIA